MEEVERLLTPVLKYTHINDESNKEHNHRVEQMTEEPKPRIAVAIAELIHSKNNLEHMRQYHGLLVYNDRGVVTDQTEEPLVGWIIAETPRAMDGGRYMAFLIYRKEIDMVMIDQVLGHQMIDTIQAAGMVDIIYEENNYGDRLYGMVHQLASTE